MSLREHVNNLNNMILQGQILDAFDKYYAEDVQMAEVGQEPRVGKAACRQFEEAFVSSLTAFRGAEVKAVTTDEENGVAMVEWFFDYTHKDWGDRTYDQVTVQHWKEGEIVKETFYYA